MMGSKRPLKADWLFSKKKKFFNFCQRFVLKKVFEVLDEIILAWTSK